MVPASSKFKLSFKYPSSIACTLQIFYILAMLDFYVFGIVAIVGIDFLNLFQTPPFPSNPCLKREEYNDNGCLILMKQKLLLSQSSLMQPCLENLFFGNRQLDLRNFETYVLPVLCKSKYTIFPKSYIFLNQPHSKHTLMHASSKFKLFIKALYFFQHFCAFVFLGLNHLLLYGLHFSFEFVIKFYYRSPVFKQVLIYY